MLSLSLLFLSAAYAQISTTFVPWWGSTATCDTSADVGKSWRNACDEWCTCVQLSSGDVTFECWRERKEITCMTATERQRFLDAFVAISTPGHQLYDSYSNLIGLHTGGSFGSIHTTQWFLPWHRWYALELENLLRQVDCRITLPWWDWTKKTTTWQTNAPFLAASNWYGTNGWPVTDGPFASPGWTTANGGGSLNRNFNGNMPAYSLLSTILGIASGSYSYFSDQLEGLHGTPHMRISGHMSSAESPRAPEFFLHHGMIDRMWGEWQKISPGHLAAYGTFSPTATMPYAFGTTPNHVLDLAHQVSSVGDCARVRYVRYSTRVTGQPFWASRSCWLLPISTVGLVDIDLLQRGLTLLPREDLQSIRQVKTAPLSDNESELLISFSAEGENGEKDAQAAREKMQAHKDYADDYYAGANVVEPHELKRSMNADGTVGNGNYASYEAGIDLDQAWEKIKGNPQVYEQLLLEQKERQVETGSVPDIDDSCCDKCGPEEACMISREGCECWTPTTVTELSGQSITDLQPPVFYPRPNLAPEDSTLSTDFTSRVLVTDSSTSICCKKRQGREVCRKCDI
jgi:tyrosinase